MTALLNFIPQTQSIGRAPAHGRVYVVGIGRAPKNFFLKAPIYTNFEEKRTPKNTIFGQSFPGNFCVCGAKFFVKNSLYIVLGVLGESTSKTEAYTKRKFLPMFKVQVRVGAAAQI